MEFEDKHDDEEQEEEEDGDDSITIPPPAIPPSYVPGSNSAPHRVNLVTPTPSSEPRRSSAVRYRDCLKNHAVNIGGYAVDGCGEFMPAGVDGTLDALICAACNCHRNFHRKEPDPTTAPTPLNTGAGTFSGCYGTPAPSRYLHTSRPAAAHPSSNTSGGTHSGGEMGDDMSQPSSSGGCPNSSGRMLLVAGRPRKRHRTKFTQEQKDKMLGFAEKLGWRIQKHDEGAVQQFCAETQVKRQVLKVWMHNNKHTLGPAAQKP